MPGYLHPVAREQLDIVGHILLDIESGFDFCPGIFTEGGELGSDFLFDSRLTWAIVFTFCKPRPERFARIESLTPRWTSRRDVQPSFARPASSA